MTDFDQFKRKIIHQLPPMLEEKAMTLAQQIEAKGKAEGEAKGKAKAVRNHLG
jgi:hypothetical protein